MPAMNRPTRKVALAAAALLLVAGAGVANLTPGGAAPEGPVIAAERATVSGWEYKSLPRRDIVEMAPGHQGEYILPKDLLEDFNRGLEVLGEQGWELVAVEPYHREGYVNWPALYTFRRPK